MHSFPRDPGRVFHLLGAPIDLGVSKLGVDMGPTAIRYAGIREAFRQAGLLCFDGGDVEVMRNFALDNLPPSEREAARRAEVARVAEELGALTHAAAARGEVPVVLGGDHSTSIGAVAGVAEAVGRLGLVWIDAHPDANTPETSPSGNVHGMGLAVALGVGAPELTGCRGYAPKVRPEDVCVVGAKDIDPGERALLERLGVRLFTIWDIEEQGIGPVAREAAAIVSRRTDGVYVSFDADVMDRSVAPGTGITTEGGLTYREISYLLRHLGAHCAIKGYDVIEVNPLLDEKNRTAELCVELSMWLAGVKYTSYEREYLLANRRE